MPRLGGDAVEQFAARFLGAVLAVLGLLILLVAFAMEPSPEHAVVTWQEHLSHLLFLVGELLFPIGCIVWLYERWLKSHTLRAAEERLRAILKEEERAQWSTGLRQAEASGLVTVQPKLDASRVAALIRDARRTVRCLTPGLLEPKDSVPNALVGLMQARRETSVQIVLLDENTPWRLKRYEEVSPEVTKLPGGAAGKQPVTRYLLKLQERGLFSSEYSERLSVLIFTGTPSVDIYQIDDIAFIGFYVHMGWAFNNPVLEIAMRDASGAPTVFGKLIDDEFERVLALGARRLSAEELARLGQLQLQPDVKTMPIVEPGNDAQRKRPPTRAPRAGGRP